MVSGNTENKSAFDNGPFLKVDSVEPMINGGGICSRDRYLDGIKVWIGGDGHIFPCDHYTVCEPKVIRAVGHREAFSLFKELYDMSPCDRAEVFGKITMYDLISKNTYDDIAKKLDAWKKEKAEIHVRDEVCQQSMQLRFVVTKIFVPSGGEDAVVNGIKKDGTTVKGLLLCNLKKTGLHVDNLDSYLEV